MYIQYLYIYIHTYIYICIYIYLFVTNWINLFVLLNMMVAVPYLFPSFHWDACLTYFWKQIQIKLVGGLEHEFSFPNIVKKSSQLTNVFQMGWNHQPVEYARKIIMKWMTKWCESLFSSIFSKEPYGFTTGAHFRIHFLRILNGDSSTTQLYQAIPQVHDSQMILSGWGHSPAASCSCGCWTKHSILW